MKKDNYIQTILSIITAFLVGAVVIMLMGYNPLEAYGELFKGAFAGKFGFGATLERFVPLLLTAIAFSVSSTVSVFNIGVEGELYLGGLAAAWVGFAVKGLPKFPHILLCIAVAVVIGGLWALIPACLKAYYRVNEVCTTILLNYVAIQITSYMVNYPLSAKSGVARTPALQKSATLTRILPPSRANTGLFIAIGVWIFVYWFMFYTSSGYKLRSVGINPHFSEYVGIDAKKNMLLGMFMSGAIGGIAGAIEVMGIHGYFLDNFSAGLAFDGMLAALIARNDMKMIPVLAFFLAILKSGALGMERFTGIENSLIDAIIATFILIASMEGLFEFKKRHPKDASQIKKQESNS